MCARYRQPAMMTAMSARLGAAVCWAMLGVSALRRLACVTTTTTVRDWEPLLQLQLPLCPGSLAVSLPTTQ